MNYKRIERIIGAVVYLLSVIVLFKTVQPSVSFWDCGEVSAAAYGMQIPHPPGSPFMTLMGRFFSMLPTADNMGLRINYLSVITSGLTILMLYLIIVKLIENYKGREYSNLNDALFTYISAAIGALAFSFSHSFWFNGTESEIYALNTTIFAAIVYFGMVWNEKADEPDSVKYLFLIAYLTGVSTTLRMFAILAIITVVMIIMYRKYVTDEQAIKETGYIFMGHIGILLIIALYLWHLDDAALATTAPTKDMYQDFDSKFKIIMVVVSAVIIGAFWKKVFNRNSIYVAFLVGVIAKTIIYPVIVKNIPEYLGKIASENANTAIALFVVLFGLLGYLIYWGHTKKHTAVYAISTCVFLIILGYTTYALILIRSNQDTPINENAPKNFTQFLSYLNREQYGDFPTFKRRFSTEDHQQGIYDTSKYSSDLSFLWKYQMNHMMSRYILWTYGGRSTWTQDSGPNVYPFNGVANIFGKIFNLKFEGDGHNSFYGIPFLIGLMGIFFHFKKDWKMATAFLVLFIFTTYLFAFYQNQQEPQPRERDKFYAAGGLAFAIWIGIAIHSIIYWLKEKIKSPAMAQNIGWVVLLVGMVFVPGRMLVANYHEHDRSENWIPWDLAYNMLQSCAPNAIMFTNGDNDTFPLWYLQEVEGIRTDIRIVNLSLANTPWYISQLKNLEPHGALKVKMSIPDSELTDTLFHPVEWVQSHSIEVPADFNKRCVNYNNYTGLSDRAKSFLVDEYDIKDSSVIRNGRIDWTMESTCAWRYEDGLVKKSIRAQDRVVTDIIEQNHWVRPIYFAVTCSEDCKVGLADYCKMEGIAFRLVPEKQSSKEQELVNEKILTAQLYEENKSFSKVYEPGFKFRGLNGTKIFLDDNQERLVQNYRNSFVRLALYLNNKALSSGADSENLKKQSIEALNLMESKMPRKLVRLDPRIMYQIANLYGRNGDSSLKQSLIAEMETQALKEIEDNPADFAPYRALMQYYEDIKSYKKIVNILVKLQASYPEDPQIGRAIQQYKMMQTQADTSQRNETPQRQVR